MMTEVTSKLAELISSMSEWERDKCKKRFESEDTVLPLRATYFFPEEFNLDPFSITGLPTPRRGDLVTIRSLTGRFDNDPFGKLWHKWKVQKLWWSIATPTNEKDKLLFDSKMHVEVYLVPHRPLSYWNLKFIVWVKTFLGLYKT